MSKRRQSKDAIREKYRPEMNMYDFVAGGCTLTEDLAKIVREKCHPPIDIFDDKVVKMDKLVYVGVGRREMREGVPTTIEEKYVVEPLTEALPELNYKYDTIERIVVDQINEILSREGKTRIRHLDDLGTDDLSTYFPQIDLNPNTVPQSADRELATFTFNNNFEEMYGELKSLGCKVTRRDIGDLKRKTKLWAIKNWREHPFVEWNHAKSK